MATEDKGILPRVKAKVLIVEDKPTYQRLYSKLLTQLGYWVIIADTLQVALDTIARHFFHVAIVDVRLVDPDRSNDQGFAVLDKLLEVGENTGGIVLTAYPTNEGERKAFTKYQVVDFIDKSEYKEDQLLAALEKATEHSKRYLAKHEEEYLTSRNLIHQFELGQVESQIMGRPNGDVIGVLINLIRPIVPIRASAKFDRIDSSGQFPVFESHYWSRFLGKEIVIRVGRRKQILEEVTQLKQTNQDVYFETRQSVSGIRYVVGDTLPDRFVTSKG